MISELQMAKRIIKYWLAGLIFILSGCASQKNTLPPATDSNLESMVFVEGGSFMMGSNDGYPDELPIHEATLSPFWIGKYQVTKDAWLKIMALEPSEIKDGNLPMEQISWLQAIEYCNQRSIHEDLPPCYTITRDNVYCDFSANGYRLPTEAEWEYAARGGKKSAGFIYSGSNDHDNVAWHDGNSQNKSHPVGTKKANELGIHDMSGNLFEWCWDWYDKDYYEKSPGSNPKGPETGTHKVLRGGSWHHFHPFCRVSFRNYYYTPYYWNIDVGFRIVRSAF